MPRLDDASTLATTPLDRPLSQQRVPAPPQPSHPLPHPQFIVAALPCSADSASSVALCADKGTPSAHGRRRVLSSFASVFHTT